MGVVIRFIKKMDTKFSGDVSTLCLLKNLLKIIILRILSDDNDIGDIFWMLVSGANVKK